MTPEISGASPRALQSTAALSAAEVEPTEPSVLSLDRFSLSRMKEKIDSPADLRRKYLGFPAGILAFLIIYLLPTPPGLLFSGQGAMAVFALALIWWVTEPVPNYVTSFVLMMLLVFLGIRDEARVLGALGLSVIWLNVTAFVLSSLLIKTNLAKRLALKLILRFGGTAGSILMAFMLLQLILAPLIPSTAARTVMTLPIMMIVAVIYGSGLDKPNNFGRNIVLQNQMGINMFSSAFLTGSTCNLIAVTFILDMAAHRVYYSEWLLAAFPPVMLTMLAGWWLGPKLVFPLSDVERKPCISGGLESLRGELDRMGPLSSAEKKGIVIFAVVLLLWVTDRFHMGWFGFEVSAVMAAMLGAAAAFFPRYGVLKWNEADIPWNLLLFSSGAYAGGMALEETGAARWAVGLLFDSIGIGKGVGFFPVFMVIVAITAYSHFFFTSKTMRTLILIPIIIAIAQKLGFDPVSLALPAAVTLSWVIGLPISAKPNVILYSTGQFSVMDNFKYGFIVITIGVALMGVMGLTWYRYLGITP